MRNAYKMLHELYISTDSSVIHSFLENCKCVLESIEYDYQDGRSESEEEDIDKACITLLKADVEVLKEFLPEFIKELERLESVSSRGFDNG